MTEINASKADKLELHVSESDTKDLTLIDWSDVVFAVIYSVLFIWGLTLTLLAI